MDASNKAMVALLAPFSRAATECAHQMLSNATYMLAELPNVRMSDELRSRTQHVCQALIGTKHDLITELVDLDALVGQGGSPDAIAQRVERITRWAREDLVRLNEIIVALQEEMQKDPLAGVVSILIMESATNILNPYNAMRAEEKRLLAAMAEAMPAGGVPT